MVDLSAFEKITNITFNDKKLLEQAFIHRSYINESTGSKLSHNERLEFLGDAILGAVVAEMLFKRYPYKNEGFLTEMRSKIVSRVNLNQLARKLGFNELVEYDAKMVNYGNKQSSLLGDAFEAFIGAVYLDKGYNFTKDLILNRIIQDHVDVHQLELTETNFKSKLIEWCQREGKDFAFEPLVNEAGDSEKLFSIQALVDGEAVGLGRDFNKKNAEKMAAEKACETLSI